MKETFGDERPQEIKEIDEEICAISKILKWTQGNKRKYNFYLFCISLLCLVGGIGAIFSSITIKFYYDFHVIPFILVLLGIPVVYMEYKREKDMKRLKKEIDNLNIKRQTTWWKIARNT